MSMYINYDLMIQHAEQELEKSKSDLIKYKNSVAKMNISGTRKENIIMLRNRKRMFEQRIEKLREQKRADK